jgi:beta-mannosidase
VHTDLVKNRIIPDPLTGTNEAGAQWVGEQDWIYRTEPFDLPASAQGREALMLRFNGLDTYATVLLNDEVILTANNAFRMWEVDVKKRMKKRGNVIEIRFRNPLKEAEKHLKLLPYPLPGDAQRAVTRKPQYHYGWDWGPRLLTCGITDAIELLAWDVARFQDVYVRQDKVNEKQADLTAIFELEVQREDPCSLFFYIPQTRETYATQVQLKKGMNLVELAMSIPYPRLWWCNGQGESFLYTFHTWLKCGDKVVDQKRMRTGIRTIDLVTKKDSIGEAFRFDLNGLPVFAKGANVIPMAYFPAVATEEDYRNVLTKCRDAHFNMIRVWGGGVYEKDILYDLCDEYGIMVWQDFMFACSMYPADSLFIPNVIEEANQQTRRLRNHACIALWCGNNESAEGWARWGWQDGLSEKDRTRIKRAYDDLFTLTLEPIVKRNTTTDYWESSPRLGRGDPRSINEGDSHYWGLWHDEEPFEVLQQKIPRFMSEFGMQSFPSAQTLRLMSGGAAANPDHPGVLAHQKHPRGFALMKKYAERWYPGADKLSPERYAKLTQVVQAEGMCAGIEAHRRTAPRCMGSLYWQLNDVWPSFSWSSIDYTGKEKLLFSMLKESFAPKLITYAIEEDKLRVWFLNDKVLPDSEKLDLFLAVRTYDGKELYRFASADNVLTNGLQLLHEKSLSEMGITDPRDKVIIVELNDTHSQTRYRRYGKLVPASDRLFITWMENGAVIPQVLPE